MWCPEALCEAVLKELLGALHFMYSAHAEHFADNQQYWIRAGYSRPHLGEYWIPWIIHPLLYGALLSFLRINCNLEQWHD